MEQVATNTNETRDTARTAMANAVANVLSMVFGIVVVPIITRILSTSDVGIANTFFVTRNIVAIVIALGAYGFVYKAMLEFKEDRENYLFTISLFCMMSSAFFFLLSMPFRSEIEKLLTLTPFLYYWMLPSVVCFSLYSIASYYCIFTNKSKLTASMIIAIGPFSQVVSVILALVLPSDKYIGRVLGLDIAMIIVSLVLMVWLVKNRHHTFKLNYVLFTLRYSIAIIPHSLSQILLTQLDLLMISYFIGSAEAGIYSMAYTIGLLGYTALSQVMGSWSTWVYRRFDEKALSPVRSHSALVVFFGLLASLVLMLLSPELVRIFLPPQYEPAIYVLMPLVAANFFQFVYLFFYDVGYYNKKTALIAIASTVTAVMNFGLNLLLIPRYGFLAAAYTTLASYMVLAFLNYLIARKFGVSDIYKLPVFAVCCAMCLITMIASVALIDFPWIRIVLLAAIVTAACFTTGKPFVKLAKTLLGKDGKRPD